MSAENFKLRDEVEELLEKLVVAEVSQAVWTAFEKAMASLDPESRRLLEDYFNETSVDTLSMKTGLPVERVEPWLKQAKQKLQHQIKKNHTVRQ